MANHNSLQLQSRVVWHLFAGCNSIDYRSSGSAIELSSFEFGLYLFLPIYSRTIAIDRYSVFTVSDEDVYKLGVMSVPQCVIYIKSFREFIKNLERLLGRLVTNVQHLFSCNYC